MINLMDGKWHKKEVECDVCGIKVPWKSYNDTPINARHPLPDGWMCFEPITNGGASFHFCPDGKCQAELRITEAHHKNNVYYVPRKLHSEQAS